MRDRNRAGSGRVGMVELFFDLVFVFAVTQLSHTLLAELTLANLVRVTMLFMAVWWVWMYTAWTTNWLDPERLPVRICLFVLTIAGLFLSMSIPHSFAERGIVFAAAYASMQVGRTLFVLWAVRGSAGRLSNNFQRICVWLTLSGACWIVGGFAEPGPRLAWWTLALGIELLGPWALFWVPGLGRSSVTDWNVDGGHMAERCALFVIIALGESLLVTGATFTELTWDLPTLVAFFSAVLGSVLMWWLYFDTGAERAQHRIVHAGDPGRTARSAYTYVHIVIVAGIIVCAVADEVVLMHPLHGTTAALLAVLGGPACYLIGAAWFKWLTNDRRTPPLSHMIGLVLFAMLVWPTLTHAITPLVCGIATTLVFAVVAGWETVALSTIRTEAQPDHR
ncbi:MAG TPA: low temperature requirement protein A [Steroidobacteraceae bacterium]|nr:low temperature requirement protein A [Steroidobacteraceae bacterium]